MTEKASTYKVQVILTTIGTVTVSAQSSEVAESAVQFDLDHGATTLADDILRIENEIPFADAKAKVIGVCSDLLSPEYIVNEKGVVSPS